VHVLFTGFKQAYTQPYSQFEVILTYKIGMHRLFHSLMRK